MVKFHTATQTYDYPLPAVSLAYFLRYPNPYSTHVLSTDILSRTFDPATQRLSTVRLHLKRSKLPPTMLKLLPKGIVGGTKGGDGKSYVLEKSVVDVREGWMETESRNLEWTGVLSVVERQRYVRERTIGNSQPTAPSDMEGRREETHGAGGLLEMARDEKTSVTTTVTFLSRFGLPRRRSEATSSESDAEDEPKRGFFSAWSTSALQRTIEATGVQRARNALVKSREGMNVVLERLRTGGLVRAVEGMRRDRELVVGGGGPWRKVWQQGGEGGGGEEPTIRGDQFEDD